MAVRLRLWGGSREAARRPALAGFVLKVLKGCAAPVSAARRNPVLSVKW